jgi:hypothetical protein
VSDGGCRFSSTSGTTTTTVVLDKLQEQLLVRVRELDNRQGAIIVWEDGLAASEHALRRVCVERDVECAQGEAVL